MTRTVLCIVVIGVAMSLVMPALAFTLDFEGLPDQHYHYGGDQNLGSYYPGLTFGPDVTVLDRVIYGYNDAQYPPHSGNAVIFWDSGSYIDVALATPAGSVSAWYSSADDLTMEAYDAAGSLIASTVGSANLFSSRFIGLSDPTAGIARVRFLHRPNYCVLDDLTVTGSGGSDDSPEPFTWVLLACTGIAGAIARRRRLL